MLAKMIVKMLVEQGVTYEDIFEILQDHAPSEALKLKASWPEGVQQ